MIEDDDIKLDWFFKASLIHDLVNVSIYNPLIVIYRTLYDHLNPPTYEATTAGPGGYEEHQRKLL